MPNPPTTSAPPSAAALDPLEATLTELLRLTFDDHWTAPMAARFMRRRTHDDAALLLEARGALQRAAERHGTPHVYQALSTLDLALVQMAVGMAA